MSPAASAAWIPSTVASCRWNGVRCCACDGAGSDEEIESARARTGARIAARVRVAGSRQLSMAIPPRVCCGLDRGIRISQEPGLRGQTAFLDEPAGETEAIG